MTSTAPPWSWASTDSSAAPSVASASRAGTITETAGAAAGLRSRQRGLAAEPGVMRGNRAAA